jgi:hypothetical protein
VAVERAAPDVYDDYGSDDDHDRRHRRSSRRTRSPSSPATHRYKAEGIKTSKLDSSQYAYGESPSSARRYAADVLDDRVAHSPSSTTYVGTPFRVRESKVYGPADVKYSDYATPYYSSHVHEGYPLPA